MSSTSSGKSPKNTTPSSTPALNGTTRRVRRPALVSQSPRNTPATPIRAASSGGPIPVVIRAEDKPPR